MHKSMKSYCSIGLHVQPQNCLPSCNLNIYVVAICHSMRLHMTKRRNSLHGRVLKNYKPWLIMARVKYIYIAQSDAEVPITCFDNSVPYNAMQYRKHRNGICIYASAAALISNHSLLHVPTFDFASHLQGV